MFSCALAASEEAMAELEEVVLYAFQQCVYYVSKVRPAAPQGSRPLSPLTVPASLPSPPPDAQGVCGPLQVVTAPFTGAGTEPPEAPAALVGAPGTPHTVPPPGLRPSSCQRCCVFSPQSLYVCLPALLECPPFQTEPRESWCQAPQLPEELRRVVSIYQAALDLLRQAQVHPEIVSQVLAYLFFFSSTLLFNQLLDKGEPGGCAPAKRERRPDPRSAPARRGSAGRGPGAGNAAQPVLGAGALPVSAWAPRPFLVPCVPSSPPAPGN